MATISTVATLTTTLAAMSATTGHNMTSAAGHVLAPPPSPFPLVLSGCNKNSGKSSHQATLIQLNRQVDPNRSKTNLYLLIPPPCPRCCRHWPPPKGHHAVPVVCYLESRDFCIIFSWSLLHFRITEKQQHVKVKRT